jgi:excisionase family DNA binding protein
MQVQNQKSADRKTKAARETGARGGKKQPPSYATSAFATIPEAGAYLHLSRATIYKLMDAGQLLYAKFGDSRRIPWVGLKEYAERCTVKAG